MGGLMDGWVNGADNGGVIQKDGRERKTLFNSTHLWMRCHWAPNMNWGNKQKSILYCYFDNNILEWHVVRFSNYVDKYLLNNTFTMQYYFLSEGGVVYLSSVYVWLLVSMCVVVWVYVWVSVCMCVPGICECVCLCPAPTFGRGFWKTCIASISGAAVFQL